jgi:uncharacterized protein
MHYVLRQGETLKFIDGPAGKLELIVSQAKQAQTDPSLALICHPDPQQEGSMQNKVVSTIAKKLAEKGCTAIRFNYRGVGQSEGTYGNLTGEIADGKAVLNWAQKTYPDHKTLWLAGFSFGCYIAASLAQQNKTTCLITIAPSVIKADFSVFDSLSCPWWVIQGEDDEIVPASKVKSFLQQSKAKPKSIFMPDTSHFFHGKLALLTQFIDQIIDDVKT